MNEPRLNFFTRIYYSIASFNNYRYFLRQGPGKAVIFLMLFATLIGIFTYIPLTNNYNKAIDELIVNFDSSVPDFTFNNGELKVEGTMPLRLGGNEYPIIINTSSNPDESILDDYDSAIMLTKDKMIQKTYVNKQVTNLSALKGMTLTRADVKEALPMMKTVGIFLFGFGLIFFICGKFISALFISLIGMIISSSRKVDLSYQNIFKLSVFSLTLPMIVCTLLDILLHPPYMWLLFDIIAVVYVYGAINSIKREIESFHNDNTPVE